MFQGSRNVGKAEHMALVQAAGGTLNGSTWLDRTNYYETLPSHQAELALWLEADRMGTLLDALSQENLDNQREVVKNEKRWSYDNRPYGSWYEKLQGHLFPPEHPYHHTTIGSMEDLDAASIEDVSAFFRTYYAPNNAVVSVVGDVDPGDIRRWTERYFGGIPANPAIPSSATCRCRVDRRGAARDRSTTRCRCRGSTSASGRRSSATRARRPRHRRPGPRRRQGLAAPPPAGPRRADRPRTSPSSRSGFVGGASICAGWATVRPGVPSRPVEAALHEELDRLAPSRSATTSWPAPGAHRDRGARGPVDAGRSGRSALDVRDAFDDPGLINRMLPRYLAVTRRRRSAASPRPSSGPRTASVLTSCRSCAGRQTAAHRRPSTVDHEEAEPVGAEGPTRRSPHDRRLRIVAERPTPRTPRPYDFPAVDRCGSRTGCR
jgi:hypothetical protein